MMIAVIGGGAMGEAIIAAFLDRKKTVAENLKVHDASQQRRAQLKERYSVMMCNNNVTAVQQTHVVVLAVKPQNLEEVMAEIKGQVLGNHLVISVVAGASLETLTRGLDHSGVVRVMPNIGARAGAAVSLWTAASGVDQSMKDRARNLLEALGTEVYTDQESYLDMATAVSGSGPAYFFLFVEALVDAATGIGLPGKLAEKLALGTLKGSQRLLEDTGETAAQLRESVTSPGGTTAQALARFEEGDLRGMVAAAVKSAYQKARDLGEKSG
jgi:pyrroline-5-carboxylate reductase